MSSLRTNALTTTATAAVGHWSRRLILAGLLTLTTLSVGTAQAASIPPQAGLRPHASGPAAPSAQAVSCNPRPRVVVQSEPAMIPASSGIIGPPGVDALLVTVTTTGAGKGMRALRFTGTTNGTVTVLDAIDHAAPYEVTFPAGNEPGKVTFALWRQDIGRGSFARLVVVDACGEWTTFVGRGPRSQGQRVSSVRRRRSASSARCSSP